MRIHKYCWLSPLILLLFVFWGMRLKGAEDPVGAFKKYLSNPPCISRITYSEASCDDKVKRTEVGGWCGSSFYLRELTGTENLDLPISLTNRNRSALYVGRLGDSRWEIAGYRLGVSIQPNLASPDPYAGMSDSMQTLLGGIVNLGSQHVQPGTFVWSGDDFSVKASPFARQFGANEFRGHIVVTGGYVTRMVIDGSGTWDYKYSAAATLPLGIPDLIICVGNNHCISKIMIKELTLGTPSDENTMFDPLRRIDKSIAALTVLSNGVEVVKPASNFLPIQLAKAELLPSGGTNMVTLVHTTKHDFAVRRTIVLLFMLVSTATLVLVAYRARAASSKHHLPEK